MKHYVVVGHFDDLTWKLTRYFEKKEADRLVTELNEKYLSIATFEVMPVSCKRHSYPNPCEWCDLERNS